MLSAIFVQCCFKYIPRIDDVSIAFKKECIIECPFRMCHRKASGRSNLSGSCVASLGVSLNLGLYKKWESISVLREMNKLNINMAGSRVWTSMERYNLPSYFSWPCTCGLPLEMQYGMQM